MLVGFGGAKHLMLKLRPSLVSTPAQRRAALFLYSKVGPPSGE
jgi:hypothetical protein